MCLSRECAVAEFMRFARRQAIGATGLLPRRLYIFEIELERVLDLTDPKAQAGLGVDHRALVDDDRRPTQAIGHLAHQLEFQAICSPSATGVGDVLAVLVENVGSQTFEPHLAEEWTSLEDSPPEEPRRRVSHRLRWIA